jgi:hypothetical protein
MRSLILSAIAAALTTVMIALPAQAQPHRHHQAQNMHRAYGAADLRTGCRQFPKASATSGTPTRIRKFVRN